MAARRRVPGEPQTAAPPGAVNSEFARQEQSSIPKVPWSLIETVGQYTTQSNTTSMATKTTRADFQDVFPLLVEDLLGECRKFNLPDNALQWFEKVPRPYTHSTNCTANRYPSLSMRIHPQESSTGACPYQTQPLRSSAAPSRLQNTKISQPLAGLPNSSKPSSSSATT